MDKVKVRRAFNKGSKTYDRAATLQREVGKRLLRVLEGLEGEPNRIIDLGAGTGYFSQRLKKQYEHSKLFVLDSAESMICFSRSRLVSSEKIHLVCADADELPFENQSIDLVFSNLMLQWSADLNRTLHEIKRVLVPNGLFVFSTFGENTLYELRSARNKIKECGHLNTFLSYCNTISKFEAYFYECRLRRYFFLQGYKSLLCLIQELKRLGANYVPNRKSGLFGKKYFTRLMECYEENRSDKKEVKATFEVILGWGRK